MLPLELLIYLHERIFSILIFFFDSHRVTLVLVFIGAQPTEVHRHELVILHEAPEDGHNDDCGGAEDDEYDEDDEDDEDD